MPAANWPGGGSSAPSSCFTTRLQKLVRQRGEDAGAVARVRLAAAGAAVVHVAEHFLGIDENLVAALALDVRNEAHAARIVLERRVVQALLRRRAERRSSPNSVLLRAIHGNQLAKCRLG